MTTFFYWYGWLFVRPRRWFFGRMMGRGSFGLRLLPKHVEYWGWRWPNLHWWLFYKTVFNFCNWLAWEGWRPFCDWTGGYRRSFPWIARMIKRLGETTAGVHCRDCTNNQVTEIDNCAVKDCPLYRWRSGKNPYRTKKVMTEEQRKKSAERLAMARVKNSDPAN